MSITNLPMGDFLTILFSKNVRMQMNTDASDWDWILSKKHSDPMGRETRFQLQDTLSPAAVRGRSASNRTFPQPQTPNTQEYIASYKEVNATLGLEQNLYQRAIISRDEKYADPLAQKMMTLAASTKKYMSANLYLDGSGVLGQVVSVNQSAIAAGRVVVTLNSSATARGHTGAFEDGDIIIAAELDGTARVPSGGSGTGFAAYRVVSKNRAADTVTLDLINASGAVVINYGTTNLAATDVFYRNDEELVAPDLTSGSLDYGSLVNMPGLASLAADDGRLVHGITMSGALAGSQFDAEGDAIALKHLGRAMTNVKTNVGEEVYSWTKAIYSPEAFDAFIEINQADRLLTSSDDETRGGRKFTYQHRNDTVEFRSSIYVPKNRIWLPPEPKKKDEKVIECHVTDFSPVRLESGDIFHLAPASGGGHTRDMVSYLQAYGTYIAKHPAAIACIKNFTLGA